MNHCSSIPAGTYVLMPSMYATLPGAYRIVQVASNVLPGSVGGASTPDGSQYVTGYFGNDLTGTRSSQLAANAALTTRLANAPDADREFIQ